MKLHVFVALAAGAIIAAGALKEDTAKEDLKKMEGTWVMVSGEEKGEKLSEPTVKSARLTIVGDKHTVKLGDETIIGTHKLDPTKQPKSIDAMDTAGRYKGKTTLGIYKLAGDEFTVCFAPRDKDRSKRFTTKSGTGELFHVWKRQKE